MACDLATVTTDVCDSGIGKVIDPIMLLQLIAELSSEVLVAAAPGTDVTVDAILERACTSGIANVENQITLLQIIAQNECEIANA